jgi:hypothetical protein
MLYFERWRQSKKLPEIGETLYLIPIRYWEPDDYKPIKFIVKKASITDGRLSLYGEMEAGSYQPTAEDMYSSVDIDGEWYYSYENARKAQLLLAQLYEIIGSDDNHYHVDKVLKDMEF